MNADADARLADALGRPNRAVALTGSAGLAERGAYVNHLRLLFWGVLATAIAFPPLFLQATSSLPGEHLETLILADGMLIVVAFVALVWARDLTPYFDAGRFYTGMLPLRALWAPGELGQFTTDEVQTVRVRTRQFAGLDLLEVTVKSRGGRAAVFAGFPGIAIESDAAKSSVVLQRFSRAPADALGGGAEEVLAWAREAGVALETEDAANSP